MLLVDHREPEAAERDLLLDQGVGPDDDRRHPGPQARMDLLLFAGREAAHQQLGRHTQRREQPREGARVLLGQHLGRRHERGLEVVLGGQQHREQRHHRLAAAHVALEQPMHAHRRRHVGDDFLDGALLGAGQLEGERLAQLGGEVALHGEADAGTGLPGQPARAGQHQLEQHQLLEGEAAAAGLGVVGLLGPVQDGERLGERDHFGAGAPGSR